RMDPLTQPAFDLLPLRLLDDSRDDVEGEDLLPPALIPIDVEGDTGLQQRALGGLLSPPQVLSIQRIDHPHERLRFRAHKAFEVKNLIEKAMRFVAGEIHRRA